MQFDVIYLEIGAGLQPNVAFWTLEFCSCVFVFSRTCMTPNFLPFQRPVFVCLVLSSFIWLMDRACLSCLVVWVEGPFPVCCIRFLSSVSLNSHCNNFQPQEARLEWIWEAVCMYNEFKLKYSCRRKASWMLLCFGLWNKRKYIEELSMYELNECSVPGIYVLLE